jgi:beta-fructofuranosidase
MNAGKSTRGWNGLMTLPRKLTLVDKDKLGIEPAGAVESLRGRHDHVDTMTIPANRDVVLKNVSGNAIEIAAEFAPSSASVVELNVLQAPGREEVTRIQFFRNRGYRNIEENTQGSAISIDSSYSSISPDVRARIPETAPVMIDDKEPLKLRVFIDKSVVEVFVNGRQCLAVRVYPERPDSVGVSLRSQGQPTVLTSLDAWQMSSIYR